MCLFRFLFDRADRYAAQSTWRDFALVKVCLFSLGVLMGLIVPVQKKKRTALAAGLLFLPTYAVLLRRFLPFLLQREPVEEASGEDAFCGANPCEAHGQE